VSSTVHVILNPQSAGGRGARVLPRLRTALREREVDYQVHVTDSPEYARKVVRSIRGLEAARLLVVGGDGTLHEVVNALLERPGVGPALAVLPVGTGNDFHRMVRGPTTPEGVVSLITSGQPRSFEVGRVSWEGGSSYFVNLLGMGIDVAVLHRRQRFRLLPGKLQYLAALAAALVSFRALPLQLRLETDLGREVRIRGDALLAAVTVGPSVGGGFVLSPLRRAGRRTPGSLLRGTDGLHGRGPAPAGGAPG